MMQYNFLLTLLKLDDKLQGSFQIRFCDIYILKVTPSASK